jgi:ABC-type multidrug transport system fused ATPase/permease subunit
MLQGALAAAERVFAFLDEEEVSADPEHPIAPAEPVRGRVSFEHVRFGYDARPSAHARRVVRGGAGAEGRHRRADRRRQDDPRQPAHAVLRDRRRAHHPGRGGHAAI